MRIHKQIVPVFFLPAALLILGNLLLAQTGENQQPAFPQASLDLTTRVAQFKTLAEKMPAPLAKIFQTLATPFDEIEVEGKKTLRIVPVPQYLGSPGSFKGKINVVEAGAGEKRKKRELTKDDVLAWKPYEETALAQVDSLLKDSSGPEELQAAQKILVGVLYFHLTKRDRPPGEQNPWKNLEEQLSKKLLAVRQEYLQKLTALADQKNLEQKVLPLAGQLLQIYPEVAAFKDQTVLAQTRLVEMLLEKKQYGAAQAWLGRSETLLPDHPQVKTLRQKLQEAVPPQIGKKVLRIGVKELPEFLSPALACTHVEKQAVELLFESLVAPHYDATVGQYYEPVLARSLPKILVNGRRFSLRPDAFFSTGQRVTLGDIRSTIELLRASPVSGLGFLWSDVVELAPFGGKPLELESKFNQAFFDPLLPFTFPVLPQTYQGKPLPSADDPQFARAPVGSGLFAYQKPDMAGAAKEVRFVANKYHAAMKKNPDIGEIVFSVSKNPAAELSDEKKPLHLLLDLTEEQVAYLKSKRLGKVESLKPLRIYFLAVNHRKKALQDGDLRQALAKAIDRELLLNQCFRCQDPAYDLLEVTGAALGTAGAFLQEKLGNYHHELNGPFPFHSWATAPKTRVPEQLHKPDQALLLFRKVKDRVKELTLTLAYPGNDPRVAIACQRMADQISDLATKADFALKLQLKLLPPRQLCEAVHNHDYDLAYYHWDYASEYYWLWPMFDPSPKALGKKGTNFLGYQNDADLEGLLRKRMGYHDFTLLKEISHDVHAHLNEHMPFIPLWQLDKHLAIHPQLETTPLEPQRLFGDVTDWKLKGP